VNSQTLLLLEPKTPIFPIFAGTLATSWTNSFATYLYTVIILLTKPNIQEVDKVSMIEVLAFVRINDVLSVTFW